ncbi:hypothetical protein BGX29_008159 [Mortierella sp. GBA35]|nr:hypothetical protein BGX23_007732 [Mortierella sp. AD031]KAF9097276.1 hypothetical protein BGX29_008159 [Mortierella sp. GBA35]
MSSLSALRPRPLSLTAGPRRVSEHTGVVLSTTARQRQGHVRWASLAHFDMECSTPPPPPPMTLEQVDKMKQMKQQHLQHQQQMQLESDQRLRQQQELERTLAKDRVLFLKRQQQRHRQRAESWSGTAILHNASPSSEVIGDRHSSFDKQSSRQEASSQDQYDRCLSGTPVQSFSPMASPSPPLFSKSRTGGRPKSMFTLRGADQKMRLTTMAPSPPSAPNPLPNLDMTLDSSAIGLWDIVHQGLQIHQEEEDE